MDIENITNEELATAAQEGNNEVMPLLWEKNERLVKLIMFKHLNKRKLPPCIDEEDILQCGYFALLAAVKAYKPGEYKFTTYLNYSIQNAVNECINGRKRTPDNQREVSYNQRIKNADNDDLEMWELLKDEEAEFEIFEDMELSDEQRIVLDAVSELEPEQRSIIQRHYFRNMTLKEIACQDNCSIENIRRYERQAFKKLRNNPAIRALNEELQSNRFIKAFDPYRISPEYYNALDAAQRLKIKLLKQKRYISYGHRQAEIFLLLYRAEQDFKRRNEKYYR